MRTLHNNYGPIKNPFWKMATNGKVLLTASGALMLCVSSVRDKVGDILDHIGPKQTHEAIEVHPNRTLKEAAKRAKLWEKSPEHTSYVVHRVAHGDTLGFISIKYNVSLSKILGMNKNITSPGIIREGMDILIPMRNDDSASTTQSQKGVLKNHKKVEQIGSDHEENLQKYLDTILRKYPNHTPKNSVTGKAVIRSAKKFDIPWSTLMAIMQNDSHFGTQGKGRNNNNPGNYGQTDEKDAKGITVSGYKTIDEGIDAVSRNILHRIRACQKICGKGYTPSTHEIVSGVIQQGHHKGERFFGAYMTHSSGPNSVAYIEDMIRTNFSNHSKNHLKTHNGAGGGTLTKN
ncbi:MAG: LysM peptidoglycan-binding domain-containing protein [Candidatus Gracilibacteria bacterium]